MSNNIKFKLADKFGYESPFKKENEPKQNFDEVIQNELQLFFGTLLNIEIENTYVPKNYAEFDSPERAKNFTQLISLVKEAELKLIAAGYEDVGERIHIIRGIYYGTPWSVDYYVEKSLTRNIMFQKYTFTSQPIDPRQILGQTLFRNFFNSAEVYDSTSKGVDFGHLIIGLDARRSYLAREKAYPMHGGGTGLEICTWLGDLGGGAAMLAIHRATNQKKRAIEMFRGSSFGGWINLEGDVAAFLVARHKEALDITPSIHLHKGELIADALKDYLLNTKEWNNRSRNFLLILGAEFKKNSLEIVNIVDLKRLVSSKILEFGEWYMLNRLRQKSKLDIDLLIEASSHLIGASKEVTDILIHILLENCITPIKPLSTYINPEPTPKGKPFAKYVAMKKAFKLAEKSKDWLKEINDWIKAQ